jgi:ferredoxin-type protein NapF
MEERANISRRAFLTGRRDAPGVAWPTGAALPPIATISVACLARQGVACQSCRDACPQDAIRFRPRAGGPFLPEVDDALCNGCGACVAPCPVGSVAVAARQKEPIHA